MQSNIIYRHKRNVDSTLYWQVLKPTKPCMLTEK